MTSCEITHLVPRCKFPFITKNLRILGSWTCVQSYTYMTLWVEIYSNCRNVVSVIRCLIVKCALLFHKIRILFVKYMWNCEILKLFLYEHCPQKIFQLYQCDGGLGKMLQKTLWKNSHIWTVTDFNISLYLLCVILVNTCYLCM